MGRVSMVVSNGHLPDRRVQKEAEALIDAGWVVEVHAFDRLERLPAEETMGGVRVIRHRVGRTPYGRVMETARGLIRFRRSVIHSLRRDPTDVIHCHDADTLAVGTRLRSSSCKLVFDMHDLHHTWIRMSDPGSLARKVASRIMERRMLWRARTADLVVTSSGAMGDGDHPGFREWLSRRGIEAVVVENRPDPETESMPLPERPAIGYIGTVREPLMFERLIEALRLIPSADCPSVLIAGDGVAAADVERLFAEAPDIESEVSGRYSPDDLPGLMVNISMMYAVYPMQRGNIPEGALATKMFDAASFGRPSIVNAGCLMEDIVTSMGIGTAVEAGDGNGLAAAIRRLSTTGERVTLEAGWERESARLIEAYRHLTHTS